MKTSEPAKRSLPQILPATISCLLACAVLSPLGAEEEEQKRPADDAGAKEVPKSGDARPPGGDGSMFYRVFVSRNDKNGDGVIEKSEFRGGGARFDEMDANKNGKLDRAEIDVLHRKRMADPLSMRQRIERGETRRPPFGVPTRPGQNKPDRAVLPPQDGEPTALTPLGTRITAKGAFARLDVDRDGAVTAVEFQRSPGMGDAGKAREVVSKVDRDGNGSLSFEEFNSVFAKRHAPVAADPLAPPCKAATSVANPWSKRLPQGWWKKRHEETLAAPGREECRIVFLGDSITDGWDQEGSGLKIWEKEFVSMKALNLGINCDSTQHVLWRLDHGAVDGLAKLKVAVVMIGVNNKGITRDKPADIAVGIEAICGRLRAKAPHARILLLGVFPRFFGKDQNSDVNDVIAKLHDGEKVFYLNINDQLLAAEGAIKDRVGHLTEKGYEVWADSMRPLLGELMKE